MQAANYATGWDYFKAQYIEFISNTELGKLVKDSAEAYKLLTMTDSQRRNENIRK
jgi:hypothetical protein